MSKCELGVVPEERAISSDAAFGTAVSSPSWL